MTLLLYQQLLPKNHSFLTQIQKTKIKKGNILKKSDVTRILVSYTYILNVIKAACQFLKPVLILVELIKREKR